MIQSTAFTALIYMMLSLDIPIKVNSGYRTKEHNERIGGAPNSRHLHGKAFDIATHHLNSQQKERLTLEAIKLFDHVIVYKTHIHVHIK